MVKYSDLNTSFRASPAENNSVLYDLNAIKKNLERLFTTGKGDVPFNRQYGTILKTLLFENNLDPADVKMFLYMDITDWEPRVNLNPSDIVIEKKNNNQYLVTCSFSVPSLGGTTSTVQSTITNE